MVIDFLNKLLRTKDTECEPENQVSELENNIDRFYRMKQVGNNSLALIYGSKIMVTQGINEENKDKHMNAFADVLLDTYLNHPKFDFVSHCKKHGFNEVKDFFDAKHLAYSINLFENEQYEDSIKEMGKLLENSSEFIQENTLQKLVSAFNELIDDENFGPVGAYRLADKCKVNIGKALAIDSIAFTDDMESLYQIQEKVTGGDHFYMAKRMLAVGATDAAKIQLERSLNLYIKEPDKEYDHEKHEEVLEVYSTLDELDDSLEKKSINRIDYANAVHNFAESTLKKIAKKNQKKADKLYIKFSENRQEIYDHFKKHNKGESYGF